MCLPPAQQERLTPPSEKAQGLAEYFRVVVAEHAALAVLLVLVGDWYWGTYALLAAVVGHLSVSRPDYSVRQLIFYVVWTSMGVAFAAYNASLYYRGLVDTSPVQLWGFYLYNFVLAGGFVFYAMAGLVAVALLRELMRNQAEFLRNNPPPDAQQAPPGSAFGAPVQQRAADPAPAQQQQQQQQQNFRAFSGSGHRLG